MATQVKTDLIANNAITDAKIANVAITGVTASSGDSSTALATTAFVAGEINSLIDAAPGALNTLNELAAAMGDDANFSTTVTNSIATKAPLASPALTGTVTAASHVQIAGNLDVVGQIGAYNNPGSSWGTMGLRATDYTFKNAGGSVKVTIDTSGNVGIGVTPTTLGSGYTALQINGYAYNIGHSGGDHYITNNAYHNSGWKYGQTSTAQLIQMASGKVSVFTAASGTAGNAISWNTGLVQDSSGNVGIGTSTPASGIGAPLTLQSSTGYVGLRLNGTGNQAVWDLYSSYSHGVSFFGIYDRANTRYTLVTRSDGKVGVGVENPEGPLHVKSSDNEVVISDMSTSSGSFTWMSYRRNNTNKFRVFGDANDSQFGFYNDATGSTAGYYPFTITTGNNSTGSNFVGLNTNAPAKPLHVKRTSGWATMRLEGASDSGGEIEFYAGSNRKAVLWADNSTGSLVFRAGGTNTTAQLRGDGNWVGPHEDNVKRHFVGRGPFNVFDFSDNWHEFYNPAANTEHHISGSFTNAMGVTMTFPSNVTKKILQHDRTPTGTIGVIYEAVSDSSNTWNGGWNSGQFRTDPDKGYIFGYYCRRITSASNGTHYSGFSHGIAAGTGSNVDSNPYFQAFSNANLPQGVWTLHYYHLHPRYYSGTGDGGIGGVYRCDNGTRILGQTAWKQPVNQTYQVFRTYNYYCANPAVSIQWYAPFVYEVNGHEPTPAALLVNT